MNRFDNNTEEFSEEDFKNVEIEDVHDDEDDIHEDYHNHVCQNDYERKYPRRKNETDLEWSERLVQYEMRDNGCTTDEELGAIYRKRHEEQQARIAKLHSLPPPPPPPQEPGFFAEFFGRCKDILTLNFLSEGGPMDPGTNPLNLKPGYRRTCPHCIMQIPHMARTCPFCKTVS